MNKISEPLSTDQIKNALNQKVKVVTSDQLYKFKTLDELLQPYNKVVILYIWQTEPNKYGHFCCLSKYGNVVQYFDPFGKNIDSVINVLPQKFRSENHMDYKYLTKLLLDSPYEIEYNENPMQDKASSVCGRYSIVKLALSDLPMHMFQKLFTKDTMKNDLLVTALTHEI